MTHKTRIKETRVNKMDLKKIAKTNLFLIH